jgi:exodeoxyribonuclease VII small subunit
METRFVSSSNSDSGSPQPTFEQALAELEQAVHDLEEGRIGLAESLARYEQGVRLLKLCHGMLESAERRIEILLGVDAEGNAVTAPFDDQPTHDAAAPTKPRVRRRAAEPRPPAPPQPSDEQEFGSLF